MPPQELRLAITMSGGVSLAVWMGGVARELNLLTEASNQRPAVPGEQPGDTAVRALYRELLDLMQVTVSIDVLAGTSAGGINAALLGLAAVGRCDLAGLRRFWIDCGSLTNLLRDPRVADPPSLLQGDGRLLADLRRGVTSRGGQRSGCWPTCGPASAPSCARRRTTRRRPTCS